MKKLLLVTLMATTITVSAENITLKADPQPTGCQAGSTCNVAAIHSISLQNTSAETRTYKVTYQICADNKDCATHSYDVPIAPTHTWNHSQVLNLFTTFNRSRMHTATYWTYVRSPWINQDYQINGNVDVK